MNKRQALQETFLAQSGWGAAEICPLAQDASFRQYYRLQQNGLYAILMDVRPEHEEVLPFLNITSHLQKLGVRVVEIMYEDNQNGFILMEDLGNDTFTALLNNSTDELTLYQNAIDVLTELHTNPQAIDIKLGNYNLEHFINEVELFTDWYVPAVQLNIKQSNTNPLHSTFVDNWKTIFHDLPKLHSTLVLRDFHVDNLILVKNTCAVIDYQDALIGSPAYDVVSLLEDARRDISEKLSPVILARYFSQNPLIDREAFMHHYVVWGAQRHCKVAGIFVRLWLRDNKPNYLKHLHRVTRLLKNCLDQPPLETLSKWFDDHKISLDHQPILASRESLQRRCIDFTREVL